MAHGTTDSLLEIGETYDPAEMHAALVKVPAAIERLIQAVNPRSSANAYGSTVAVPVDTQPFLILPEDRSRIRGVVKIPANATGAVVAIGTWSDVASGGGFLLYAGDQLEVKTVAAIACQVVGGGNTVNISRWVEIEN